MNILCKRYDTLTSISVLSKYKNFDKNIGGNVDFSSEYS